MSAEHKYDIRTIMHNKVNSVFEEITNNLTSKKLHILDETDKFCLEYFSNTENQYNGQEAQDKLQDIYQELTKVDKIVSQIIRENNIDIGNKASIARKYSMISKLKSIDALTQNLDDIFKEVQKSKPVKFEIDFDQNLVNQVIDQCSTMWLNDGSINKLIN